MSEAKVLYDETANEEEIIAEEIAEEAGSERFVIDDDSKADWAVKKIQELRADMEYWKQYYASALEKISDRHNSRISYLMAMLNGYFKTVPHHDTKTQSSYDLPSGKLVEKHPGPKYETDDSVLLDWLKNNQMEEFIKVETREKPMWGELKKQVMVNGSNVVTADGEIVEGVTVIEQEPTFEIK